eukprot:GHVU01113495.1.p2 GENE.GHVU01113495.1~~GHVU01113495.1.p2  ORF type:complete len:119 (+),score=10.20 GHVU01113495.1:209-565(+)
MNYPRQAALPRQQRATRGGATAVSGLVPLLLLLLLLLLQHNAVHSFSDKTQRGAGTGREADDAPSVVASARKSYRKVRERCVHHTCRHLPIHEDDNCVNECVSPSCFAKVYAAQPVSG